MDINTFIIHDDTLDILDDTMSNIPQLDGTTGNTIGEKVCETPSYEIPHTYVNEPYNPNVWYNCDECDLVSSCKIALQKHKNKKDNSNKKKQRCRKNFT